MAQASACRFRRRAGNRRATNKKIYCQTPTRIEHLPTKFGGTPNLTRETRVLPTERPEQCAHFLVHLRRIGERLCDFLAKQAAVMLPQPVNRHAHGAFFQAQNLRCFALCRFPVAGREENFQLFEQLTLPPVSAHSFCNRSMTRPAMPCPFAVERLVGTRFVRGGDLKFCVRRLPVERQRRHTAAALLPLRSCPIRSPGTVSTPSAGTRGTFLCHYGHKPARKFFSSIAAQRIACVVILRASP